MISLRRSIDIEAEARERLHASLAAYRTTIDGMQKYVPPFEEPFVDRFRSNLKNIAQALEGQTSVQNLVHSANLVGEELKNLWESSRDVIARWQTDLRSLVKVMSESVRGIRAQDSRCNAIFEGFSTRIDNAAQASTITEVRTRISSELAALKVEVDAMLRDSATTLAGLESAARETESRFMQLQAMAFEDPLTGLANRRRGTASLEEMLRTRSIWSVILFDVDDFKQINDAWGHACGDSVLKKIAEILRSKLEPAGLVCRWAGDEFLAIFEGDLLKTVPHAESLRRSWGVHTVEYAGAKRDLVISVSCGLAQYITGESIDSVLARADTNLYQSKAAK